ncbi:MAG: flagellar basal body L-ring protein FlgH [Desulfobacterales bacterium]|nr:flagellar basal body L-ring protein FlgH [Desulfobacterales bacterium]
MDTRIILFLMLSLIFSGCVAQRQTSFFEETAQASYNSRSDIHVQENGPQQSHGSLWREGQNSLFTANKARSVGDLLTVAIYEQASAKKQAATSAGRSSSASIGIPNLFGLETSIANKNPYLYPANLISADSNTDFKGSGTTSREEKLSATLTTRVVEVLDGGNLRIQGSKTVKVNHEDQVIRLSGIVRPADITVHNMIDSKYILDANIEYLGKGIISEKQRPGWLVRLIDSVWPF